MCYAMYRQIEPQPFTLKIYFVHIYHYTEMTNFTTKTTNALRIDFEALIKYTLDSLPAYFNVQRLDMMT